MRLLAAALAALAVALLPACAPAAEPEPPATSEPAPEPAPPELTLEEVLHQRALTLVEVMTPRERAASVLMGTFPGTDPAALGDYVVGNGLGGFILMGDNVPGDADALSRITAAMTADAELPPLIAVDQEGGEVSRMPWDDNPGANELKFEPPERTAEAFTARSKLLEQAGVNVNFGIVADVPSGEGSFIYGRALGTTPDDAAARVRAAVEGTRRNGPAVASTLKHFPGHGAAEGDSHFGVPGTDLDRAGWAKTHALPFEAGIDAGAELLMFGHLAYVSVDSRPASLSKEWHRIAREDLGFEGVAISDDLGMLLNSGLPEYQDISAIAIAALQAGADVALMVQGVDPAGMPGVIDAVAAAVESGELSDERLREAAVRVAELRLRVGAGPAP